MPPPPPPRSSPRKLLDDDAGGDNKTNSFKKQNTSPTKKENIPHRNEDDDDDDYEDDEEESPSNKKPNPLDNKKANSPTANTTTIRVQSQEEAQQEQQAQQQQAAQQQQPPGKPCCTCKCWFKYFFRPWLYFFLSIFILVALCMSFAFIMVHGVLRLVHFLMFGLGKMRESVISALDTDKIQEDQERQHKKDLEEFHKRQQKKKEDKIKLKEKREEKKKKRKEQLEQNKANGVGDNRAQSESMYDDPSSTTSSEDEEPQNEVRILGPVCVGKSGVACLGSIFNGVSYFMFLLSFYFGFAAVSLFTSVFPSKSIGCIDYLATFRKAYDMDPLASEHDENNEPKGG